MYSLLVLLLFVVSVLSLEYGGNKTDDGEARRKKALSVFTVVKVRDTNSKD